MIFEAEFYQILGLKSNATESEIKQAFKKKAMELHPDKNRNDPKATEKFQQLNEAYETLKDPIKRKEYDLSHQPKKQANSTNSSTTFDDLIRDLFGFSKGSSFKQNNSSNYQSRSTFNQNRSSRNHNFYDDIFETFDDLDDSEDCDNSYDGIFNKCNHNDGLDTIFIGGLPHLTTERDLLEAFSSYNPYRVKVVNQSFLKPPFGFVQFHSPQAMRKAVRERPNVFINGKICRAKPSHTNLYAGSSRKRGFYF